MRVSKIYQKSATKNRLVCDELIKPDRFGSDKKIGTLQTKNRLVCDGLYMFIVDIFPRITPWRLLNFSLMIWVRRLFESGVYLRVAFI